MNRNDLNGGGVGGRTDSALLYSVPFLDGRYVKKNGAQVAATDYVFLGANDPGFGLLRVDGDAAISRFVLTTTAGGAGGSVRYIGPGGTSNSFYQNVPTGGSHFWAVNESVVLQLSSNGDLSLGPTAGFHRLFVTVASGADRDIALFGVAGVSNGVRVLWHHATAKIRLTLTDIPTASAGLPAGTVWNNAGVLNII